ncbi:MAG: hypothetical protein ACM3NT_01545 [Methylocystaceae bacterium]
MLRKCQTADDMRRLEAEISYFYSHGGPVMNDGIPEISECAMTETESMSAQPTNAEKKEVKVEPPNHTEWRTKVRGDLEAEVAYFYEHGGPIMD